MDENKENTMLFREKKECCACGACYSTCSKHAISMIEDEIGFVYPHIDQEKCIGCGLCHKVCSYQSTKDGLRSLTGYVATNTNMNQLMNSTSGGAFSAIATNVIKKGGIVYGAAYDFVEGKIIVKHIGIDRIEDLPKIQGSKYVHSYAFPVFREIKDQLSKGRNVLFSGTPCQVDAVNGLFGNSNPNFYTIDIICHGVPNQKIFNDYVHTISEDIIDFSFRDKNKGWQDFFIKYSTSYVSKHIHCRVSSYYEYFLRGEIFRENCYSCKYASETRFSDVTIGDFWGIERMHPELLYEKKWRSRLYDGISCILINTDKGKKLIDQADSLDLITSDYRRISAENGQLRNPSKYSKEREAVFEIYKKYGYLGVEKAFREKLGKKEYQLAIKALIPICFKRILKELMNKA